MVFLVFFKSFDMTDFVISGPLPLRFDSLKAAKYVAEQANPRSEEGFDDWGFIWFWEDGDFPLKMFDIVWPY